MLYRCARCHGEIESEGAPEQCPTCKAEIGFEKADGVPVAMRLFGTVLVGAILTALAGGAVARVLG